VANVVTIANVDKLEPTHGAEALFERHEVGQSLAGMLEIAECVDDRNGGILRHLGDGVVGVGAQYDAVRPAFDIAGNIAKRFAFSQRRLCLIDEDRVTAQRVDARLKAETCAQRRT
jgi:hypothetical protein